MTYDIIGGIHGQYEKLEALLRKVGYRQRDGALALSGMKLVLFGKFSFFA